MFARLHVNTLRALRLSGHEGFSLLMCQGLGSPQYGQVSSESSKYSAQLVQRIAS